MFLRLFCFDYSRVHVPHAALLLAVPLLALWGIITLTPTTGTLWFTLVYGSLNGFGVTLAYHRLFSHRTFVVPRLWLRLLLLALATGALQGSALWWTREHRRHHKFTNTRFDPYDSQRGFFFCHCGWLMMRPRGPPAPVDTSDLTKDKYIMAQHKYFTLLGPMAAFVFPACFCWYFFSDLLCGLFIAGFARQTAVWHMTFAVNSIAHGHAIKGIEYIKNKLKYWHIISASDPQPGQRVAALSHYSTESPSPSHSQADPPSPSRGQSQSQSHLPVPPIDYIGLGDLHEFDPYSSACDSWLTALLTFGEGYHNFHHAFPRDYRNGVRVLDYDPTKWIIDVLSFVGLVTERYWYDNEAIRRATATHARDKSSILMGNPPGQDDCDDALPEMSAADVLARGRCACGSRLLILNGLVLRVPAAFARTHPGGPLVIERLAGGDVTNEFTGLTGIYKHSQAALAMAKQWKYATINQEHTHAANQRERPQSQYSEAEAEAQFGSDCGPGSPVRVCDCPSSTTVACCCGSPSHPHGAPGQPINADDRDTNDTDKDCHCGLNRAPRSLTRCRVLCCCFRWFDRTRLLLSSAAGYESAVADRLEKNN